MGYSARNLALLSMKAVGELWVGALSGFVCIVHERRNDELSI